MVYLLFIWTVALVVWTAKLKMCDKELVGWANMYKRLDSQILIGAIRDERHKCISIGRCEKAKSEYLGTFKIYK